jgi:hypothetical protein
MVREAAVNNFKQLSVTLGEQWATKHFLPALFLLNSEVSYLHRLTP